MTVRRPGLDDVDTVDNLVELWRLGAADIDARVAGVFRNMKLELASAGAGTVRMDRLRAQVSRLDEIRNVAEHEIDSLVQHTRRFADVELPGIYAAGAGRVAGVTFAFTEPHRAAMTVLADDLFGDVLEATKFVDRTGKDFVRRVGRRVTGAKLTGGQDVRSAAKRLERELAGEFRQRGIGAITYRDGSRHSFGEYADMLLRTKTGVAYNAGTTNQARLAGIEYFEILDGDLCGLTEHTDPVRANGTIVDLFTAQSWPLSHPNCRRAINPRPDLNRENVEGAVSVVAPEARADQAAFEEALRRQSEQRGRRRRASRSARTSRAARSSARAPRASRGGRTARSAAPERQISTGKHGDSLKYASTAAEKRLDEVFAEMDKLHGTRPGSLVPEVQWATGAKHKGGHFNPAAKPSKPKRPSFPRRTKFDTQEAYDAAVAVHDQKNLEFRERLAAYRTAKPRPEIRIVSRKDAAKEEFWISTWHEAGHWQDYDPSLTSLSGRGRNPGELVSRYAAQTREAREAMTPEIGAMRDFWDGAKESAGFKRLINAPTPRDAAGRAQVDITGFYNWKSYAAEPHEVWARAYSQYVASKSTRPEARLGLESMRNQSFGLMQWDDDDFESLIPLIEAVLRARGVMA